MAKTSVSLSRCTIACILLASVTSAAHGQGGSPATPPEVQKTVDAFLGHWTLTGSSTEPGAATAAQVAGTLDCESAAGGMAVRCRVLNAEPGGGQIEIATIVGYSPDDHQVHLMEAASTGIYHEHRGRWNGTVIQFERLTKTIAGKRIVEDFAVGFPSPGRMTVSSLEYAAAGKSTLELVGIRQASGR